MTLPLVPGFSCLQPLGEGAEARVFRARFEAAARDVLLRVFLPERAASWEEARQRARELEDLRRGESIDGLLVHLGAGEFAGQRWLAWEAPVGAQLAVRVATQGPLPLDETLRLLAALARIVAPLHRAGRVHGELHPRHLFPGDGGVQLGDLGLADSAPSGFRAPETHPGRRAGTRADVYALGAILAYCLTGKESDPGRPDVFELARLRVPESLERLIVAAMAADPVERLAGVERFLALDPSTSANIPEASAGPADLEARFELERLLGAGAGGEAWLARDRALGLRVVVKLLHRDRAVQPSGRERFRREVLALERVEHPHVARILAHGVCGRRGQPWLATAWVPGRSLAEVLKRDAPLSLARGLPLVLQLLGALEACHARGVVHRDLKPRNVIVPYAGSARERLLLIDFGLAKHLEGGERTREDWTRGQLLGTPGYMPPEQWWGQGISPASDVYGLGCLLYEMFSGEPPFGDLQPLELFAPHCTQRPPRLDERVDPPPPAWLCQLVADCLEKEPGARPSAAELRARLAEKLASQDASTIPPERGTQLVLVAARGARIGPYELGEPVDRGGFCSVFRTRLPDGRPAALRLLRVDPGAPDEVDAAARFARELRLLSQLRHPALPCVYDAGEDPQAPWMVMELVEGENLAQRLRREGRLSEEALQAVLFPVLGALAYAHARGVVHADIKPHNICLGRDGRVVLIDLGLAKLSDGCELGEDSLHTVSGAVLGTPTYLAPELLQGRRALGPPADVYALGVLCFEALAGGPPFGGDALTLLQAHRSQPAPRLAPHQASPGWADIVARCLRKDPAERYADARELAVACAELWGCEPPLPPDPEAETLGSGVPARDADTREDPRPHAELVVRQGREAGRRVVLHIGDAIEIGRGSEVDFRLADDAVSRRHVRVSLTPGGLQVENLGSKNRTLLGSQELPVGAVGRVRHEAALRLGDHVIDLRLLGAVAPEHALPPDYRFERVLGQGAMGVVYAARERASGREVAVKVLKAPLPRDSRVRKRFFQEAGLRIDSPYVVQILACSIEAERMAIVMERCAGSLRGRMRERSLDIAEVLVLGEQVARGLAAAHRAGVIHRDVKPSNILLDASGRAKLADFGLAKVLNKHEGITIGTRSRQGMGTLAYVSPEQAHDAKRVRFPADIYSLGATLYHLLCGRPPFLGTPVEIIGQLARQTPAPVLSLRGDCPPELAELVACLLAKDPEERPEAADAAERLAALRAPEA